MNSLFAQLRDQLSGIRGRWVIVLHDVVMMPAAWLLAYWFRYNLTDIPSVFLNQALLLTPIVMVIHTATFWVFGVHRGVWRFISVPDLVRIVKAVFIGTIMVAVAIFFLTRLQYVPRSVFVLHGLFLVILVGGPRLLYRLAKDRHLSREVERKALVVGAGAAGDLLVRDLLRATPRVYVPVGFVDDDPAKLGNELHGIRVFGDCATIPLLSEKWNIDLILIALPSATAKQMQRVVEWCERSGTQFQTLPKLHEIVGGSASTAQLKAVEIDDLLGRQQVRLDWEMIANGLKGKRILVTGGGGSIGSELCKQLARVQPQRLILLEQSEFNLYSAALDLEREYPALNFDPLLGDVCDREAVQHVFGKYQPDVVFHAAAYKHVPLLEEQSRESVKNNVLGTELVARSADQFGCEAFVLISTDKAVNPTSMMGASKRVAEIVCQALSTVSATRFVTVRFGNVLGSAGSVVPLFRKQIEAGGPVTVTDPDVTRYFMTVAEASQLILQASVIGRGSEIYVLNMGEPIKISYLARQMIRLSGKTPGEDIDIVYTGLRPGEKLAEQLFHSEEAFTDTGYEKILLAQTRGVHVETVNRICLELSQACQSYDFQKIEELIKRAVPEYRSEAMLVDQPALADVGAG